MLSLRIRGQVFTILFLCNVGMDAQVAYGFHQLRDEKPFLASGPLSNKVSDLWILFPQFMLTHQIITLHPNVDRSSFPCNLLTLLDEGRLFNSCL